MKSLEKKITRYLADRAWDKAVPADLAKSISIESAELLELFQWGNISFEELKKNKTKFSLFKKEIADVFIYCFDMTTLVGVDTEKIILEKLKYNEKKFPVKKVKGTAKNYFAIKKLYRKKGY
jgi:NTP pyrophosphatase (non-canonical NTP hydrolase)